MVFWKTGGRKLYFLLRLATLIITVSCSGTEQEAGAAVQKVVHPIPALIPGFDEAKDFVASSGEIEGDVRAISQALLSPTELFTLGGAQGEQHVRFGPIMDIKEGPSGNIYVLDGQYHEVRVYSSEGSYLYAVEGPNEEEFPTTSRRGSSGQILFPASLEVDSSGRIIYADRSDGVWIFERTGKRHRVSTTLPSSLEIHEVCVREEILHIHGFSPDNHHAINRVSLSGNTLNTFGAIYSSSSPLVHRNLGMGQIACMDSRIVYAPNYLPVIYSYSPMGDMQWVTKIPDFQTLEIIETGSGVSMGVFGSPHDQVIRIAPLPETYIIVQIASFSPEGLSAAKRGRKVGHDALRTYLMSARTGEAVFVGDTVPQIYTVTESRVYTARRHPFPQVSVLKR